MSRGRTRSKAQKRAARRRRDRDDEKLDALVRDTAAALTCSTEAAQDAAAECERRCEGLLNELNYRRFAHELWRGRPGREALADTMADLIAETERHHRALMALAARFDLLAMDRTHDHIGAPEDHYDLVRKRLFDDPPPNLT